VSITHLRHGRHGSWVLDPAAATSDSGGAPTLWCGCTSRNSGGTMDTASWRVIPPLSFSRFMNSCTCPRHDCVAGCRCVRTELCSDAGGYSAMLVSQVLCSLTAASASSLRSCARDASICHASLRGYHGSGRGGCSSSPATWRPAHSHAWCTATSTQLLGAAPAVLVCLNRSLLLDKSATCPTCKLHVTTDPA
jgi:hypothetical protein